MNHADQISQTRREFAEAGLFNFFQTYGRHHIKVASGQFHVNLCSWLDNALLPGGRLIGACPREHAKTTLGTTWTVVKAAATGRKKNIIIIGANIQEAKAKKSNVTQELETNPLLLADYGESILPAKDAKGQYVRNNDTETILNNGTRIMAMEIGGKIRGQNVRGNRVDLIVMDDPESDQKVLEETWRRKMWDWIFGACINSLDVTGSIIWLGTILHFDSLLNRALLDKEQCRKWRRFKLPAIRDSRGEPTLDADGTILWPEQWNFERLMTRRAEIGGFQFAREFQNQPLDPSTQIFKPEWWNYYDQANLKDIGGIWYVEINGQAQPLHIVIGVDPAIGDDKIKRRDFFAYCVMGRTPLNQLYVLEIVQLKGVSFRDGKERVYRAADRWRPSTIVIEAESFQAAMAQDVWDAGYPVKEIKHRVNKASRIESAATHVEGLRSGLGRVYLPQGSPSQEFLEQATQWPASKNDDLLDAFTMALTEAVGRGGGSSNIVFASAPRLAETMLEGF